MSLLGRTIRLAKALPPENPLKQQLLRVVASSGLPVPPYYDINNYELFVVEDDPTFYGPTTYRIRYTGPGTLPKDMWDSRQYGSAYVDPRVLSIRWMDNIKLNDRARVEKHLKGGRLERMLYNTAFEGVGLPEVGKTAYVLDERLGTGEGYILPIDARVEDWLVHLMDESEYGRTGPTLYFRPRGRDLKNLDRFVQQFGLTPTRLPR